MAGKFKEILSKVEKKEFELLGEKVTFGRMNLAVLAKFEEAGVAFDAMLKNISDFPATWAPKIAWELMSSESQSDFDNDINVFRQALSPTDIQRLSTLLVERIQDSLPPEVKKNTEEAEIPINQEKQIGQELSSN